MKYIQCFGGIGANVVDVDPIWAERHTTDFQAYIPYDDAVHAAFRPRDRVTKNGVDATRRIAIESAERQLVIAADTLELLERNPRSAKDELDLANSNVARAIRSLDDAEKL